jgi:adenosylcobyric acid synthase
MELLEPEEKALVKAFVINKFRGDVSLLAPGIDWLEKRTGVPVAGVIPFYHDIYIAEEDSITLEKRRAMKNHGDFDLDIAVIALPHIANFDDFDPLEREPRVRLRYVEADDRLGTPDLVILPGTKSTASDLAYLKEIGLEVKISRQAAQGCPIIGICGGYQMLGISIHDPDQIESTTLRADGLGLLPVTTRFLPVKSTHQVKARILLGRGILAQAQDASISGYEIHMGQTTSAGTHQPIQIVQRSQQTCSDLDGFLSENGNILGTYIHGLFHNDGLRRAILDELAARKGKALPAMAFSFSVEEQYDRLAALVMKNLDMDLLARILDQR